MGDHPLAKNLTAKSRHVTKAEAGSRAALVVTCAVIVADGGRVLAALRPRGRSLGGKWEFPGGKVEAGESAAEALRRELQEELSIVASVGQALAVVNYDYAEFSIELHPFLVEIAEGIPHPHEHEELRWVTMTEAAELDWAAADIPVLEELLDLQQRSSDQRFPSR